MQTEPSKADPPKRKRRWFQFSLRTLMIVTAIAAVACGWLGRKIEQKRREREAIEAILKLGAVVEFDDSGASRRGTWAGGGAERDMDTNATGPRWLREFLGRNFFTQVVSVNLSHVQPENEGLASIKELPELVQLHLANCRITNSGLENLERLTHLQQLDLTGTYITDAGLPRLKQLTNLRWLWLDNTKVTDAGLANFKGLTRLQRLNLEWTYVTDAGLVHLRELTSLEELWLTDSDVTEAGVKDL